MIKGTYRFQLCFERIFPDPVIREGADNEKLGPPPARLKAAERPAVFHTVTFFEEAGVLKGVHQTELGRQKVDRVVWDEHSISWSAYSGSEGMDLWRFVLSYHQASDQIAGIAFGAPPYFRGYTLFWGTQIETTKEMKGAE